MPKQVQLKTSKNDTDVDAYIAGLEPATAREQAARLNTVFKQATSTKPKMWGGSIIGYGEYTYYRANGDEGQFMASGFAIRKSGPVLYIMPGYQDYQDLLLKLGPCKQGKSCLYLKSLDKIDLDVVTRLIKRGITDLKKTHAVTL